MANCKCGRPVIAKGMCRSCYYKNRNQSIKDGTWTSKPVQIELDDDEKIAVDAVIQFHNTNKYYGCGEELLKNSTKELKPKLAKGLRTITERGLLRVSLVPTKKIT